MTKDIKDNKNNIKYKDFWVDGLRIDGINRNILARICEKTGKTQIAIIREAVINYANQQSLKDEDFNTELAIIEEYIKLHKSDGRDLSINDMYKIIGRYASNCLKTNNYQRLKELYNFIERLKIKDENERRDKYGNSII